MSEQDRERLRCIKTFPQLVKYLRDELDWPIDADDFDELTFDYEPEELGIDAKTAAKIEYIKQLRPLEDGQPWGIFFVKFEPKRLPVVAMRRILRGLAVQKRASANRAEQAAWNKSDLLFVSAYGEDDERHINFAHFHDDPDHDDLPVLRVLGWDGSDTGLHIDHVHDTLTGKLRWPTDPEDADVWRQTWADAFTLAHREVITTSKQMAIRLADLAGGIRKKINAILAVEKDTGPLHKLMNAFREALIHDMDEDDFADTYAQTVAYGLLTARISRPAGLTADNLADMVPITNPFLKELMETFLHLGGRRKEFDFDELGINDVVEALRNANMEAVLRDFGDRNPAEDPVIHFYELFLKEYDAEKRIKRGVFYTPRPVVSYIVRSVHELLQTEFGLEDGLADTATWGQMLERHPDLKLPTIKVKKPNSPDMVDQPIDPYTPFVQILDPACGTGTFLVEVIDVVYKTMKDKWLAQGHTELFDIPKLWNEYVTEHLLPRLYGYELLMAPYAIAHMKIGLRLFETGYRFASDERARVYLTNSLEPAQDFSDRLTFDAPALAHEAQAVNHVKSTQRFTVVIGNPPYAGLSANRSRDEAGNLTLIGKLIEDYRQVDGSPLGERNPKMLQDDYVKFIRIAQRFITDSAVGLLGFITNHAYLDNPTFRGMRRALMSTFGTLHLHNLHGNSRRQERAPGGGLDQNVFQIQQGVGILVGTRNKPPISSAVAYQDTWGSRENKYAFLRSHTVRHVGFQGLTPSPPFYLFSPQDTHLLDEYALGTKISDIFPLNSVGIDTGRDALTIQWDRSGIEKVVNDFASISPEEARRKYALGGDTVEWTIDGAQNDLRKSHLAQGSVREIFYRPFDVRYTYYTGKKGFHCRPRYGVMRHMLSGSNLALITVRQQSQDGSPWSLAGVTNAIAERCAISNKTKEANYYFPLFVFEENDGQVRTDFLAGGCPNIGLEFVKVFAKGVDLEPTEPFGLPEGVGALDIFCYVYGVLHSPHYRQRYAEFLRIDFPRLPLASSLGLFCAISRLGGELVSLHLLESPLLDKPITTYTGVATPEVEKVSYAPQDRSVWLDKAQTHGFVGVPEEVWQFHLGGYQVCQKWLKDRKGRRLSKDDIAHYQKIVVALAETIKIMAQIDETIEAHGGWPGAFITDPKKLEGLQSKKA